MRIASEAWPFAAAVALLAAVCGWFVAPWAALPFAVLLVFVLWFFRDPERRAPEDAEAILSPADGRIIQAGPRIVSIFMNVFNVHVCRAPRPGRVERVQHHAGRFLAAYRDDAMQHNERTEVRLRDGEGAIDFTLVAGLVARRIVCKVHPGDALEAGQRIGLIRFGSRVDVKLPADSRVEVRLGDRVKAGESVIARLGRAAAAARS